MGYSAGAGPQLQAALETLLRLCGADTELPVQPGEASSLRALELRASLFQAGLLFVMRVVARRFWLARTSGGEESVGPVSWAKLRAWADMPLVPVHGADPTLAALPLPVQLAFRTLQDAAPSDEAIHSFWAHLDACLLGSSRDARSLERLGLTRWAPERLGMLYESLLSLTLSSDASGRWVLEPRSSLRKGGGVFYTPPLLCIPLAKATLEPLLAGAGWKSLSALRICDPAVGGGALLLAAYRCLLEQARQEAGVEGLPPAAVFALLECFYGVDSDPLALELARTALWLEAMGQASVAALEADVGGATQGLWTRFCCGDALLGTWRVRALAPAEREASEQWSPEALRVRLDEACLEVLRSRRVGRADVAPEIAEVPRFFHWEVAFPEVFAASGGFDGVLANPPWEIHKPSSVAFFEQVDPGHARLGKQEALARQEALCRSDPALGQAWKHLREASDLRSSLLLFAQRARQALAPEDDRPFQHQGRGDLNAYKLFLELGWALLRKPRAEGGADAQLGMLLPSGIYTDVGSRPLRELFLEQGGWRLLASFENRAQLFPIDGRVRFCLLVAQKGRKVEALRVTFQQRSLGPGGALSGLWEYPCEAIPALSPRARALVELRNLEDFQRFAKMQSRTTALLESLRPGVQVRARRELDLTTDSHRFVRVEDAHAQGFAPSLEGRWTRADGMVLEPLWQGAMIGMLEPCAATWDVSQRRWRPVREEGVDLRFPLPQYLVARSVPEGRAKLVYRTLSNPTNQRTLVASLIPDVPCGNSLGILEIPDAPLEVLAAVGACLTSLVYDWSLRCRMAGTNLNLYLLEETRLPEGVVEAALALALPVLLLCGEGPLGARLWAQAAREGLLSRLGCTEQARIPALSWMQRRQLRAELDARVARLYGVQEEGLRALLQDCAHPVESLKRPLFAAGLEPKGFWRLDAGLAPEARYPALVLKAFGGG